LTSTTGSRQGPPGGQPIAAACRGPRCLLRRALRRAAARGGGLPGRATPRGVEGGNQGEDAGETYGNLLFIIQKTWKFLGNIWENIVDLGKIVRCFFFTFKLRHH